MTDPEMVSSTATIRTLIAAIPDGLTDDMLTTHPPAAALGFARPTNHFWAQPGRLLWQRRHLINLDSRRGQPATCAGGPIDRLDLTLMRDAATYHAGLRWQRWQHATAGTKTARPWHEYAAEHRAQPGKITLATARTRFLHQPRINAMRLYNAAQMAIVFSLDDIEMYQAGQQAYQHYQALTALCADALLPVTGPVLRPASDALADRITYLAEAARTVAGLPGSQRLIALAV